MGIIRVLMTLPTDNGVPADFITNTMHFETTGAPVTADCETIADWIGAALTDQPAGAGTSCGNQLGSIVTGDVRLKFYDLADPIPRTPIHEENDLAFSPSADSPFPSEVALVLSFQAVPVAGVPQRRRRGRLYFGPIRSGGFTIADGFSRPNTTVRNGIKQFGVSLLAASEADADISWGVLSRGRYQETDPVTGVTTVTNVAPTIAQVDNGWVDDEWDTQRSRGPKATARSTF